MPAPAVPARLALEIAMKRGADSASLSDPDTRATKRGAAEAGASDAPAPKPRKPRAPAKPRKRDLPPSRAGTVELYDMPAEPMALMLTREQFEEHLMHAAKRKVAVNPAWRFNMHQRRALARILMRGESLLVNFDVGVGKTFVGILSVTGMARYGRRALIIVPNVMVDVWTAAFIELYGADNVRLIAGKAPAARPRDKINIYVVRSPGDMPADLPTGCIYLVQQTALSTDKMRDAFAPGTIDLLVLDEHELRNAGTKKAGVVAALRPRQTILLSASLFQNRISDLWRAASLIVAEDDPPERDAPADAPPTFCLIPRNADIGKAETALKNNVMSLAMLYVHLRAHTINADSVVRTASTMRFVAAPTAAGVQRDLQANLKMYDAQKYVVDRAEERLRQLRQYRDKDDPDVRRAAEDLAAARAELSKIEGVTAEYKITENALANGLTMALDNLQGEIGRRPRALVYRLNVNVDAPVRAFFEERGYRVGELTAELSEAERTAVIDAVKRGELDILLSSIEIGAQGLSFFNVDAVMVLSHAYNPEKVVRQSYGRIRRTGATLDTFYYLIYEIGNTSQSIFDVLVRKMQARDRLVRSLRASVTIDEGLREWMGGIAVFHDVDAASQIDLVRMALQRQAAGDLRNMPGVHELSPFMYGDKQETRYERTLEMQAARAMPARALAEHMRRCNVAYAAAVAALEALDVSLLPGLLTTTGVDAARVHIAAAEQVAFDNDQTAVGAASDAAAQAAVVAALRAFDDLIRGVLIQRADEASVAARLAAAAGLIEIFARAVDINQQLTAAGVPIRQPPSTYSWLPKSAPKPERLDTIEQLYIVTAGLAQLAALLGALRNATDKSNYAANSALVSAFKRARAAAPPMQDALMAQHAALLQAFEVAPPLAVADVPMIEPPIPTEPTAIEVLDDS